MTTFTVARKSLAPVLARAAQVVPSRSTIPILGCALLQTTAEGLFVSATDLDMIFRERVDAVPREPWHGIADVVRLDAFVDGVPADSEIGLRTDDENRLSLRAGKASCRLPMLAEEFPLFSRPNGEVVALTFDATALAAGLRAVAPAMSDEPSRHYMNGAFLHSGKLCATDGHRLHLQTIATDTPPAPEITIPGPTVKRLLPLLRGVVGPLSVCVSERQITVSTEHWALTSKLIDGTFPDYRVVLPERSPSPLLVRRKALRDAAALIAAVHHGDKARGLRLSTSGVELLVTSTGSEALGTCEVTVPVEGEPPATAWMTCLNHTFLLAALDTLDGEQVELHVSAEQWAPIWLCTPGEAHDGSVIVPMRV